MITGDEDLYLQATRELDNGEGRECLWAKAIILKKGNTEQARYTYLQLRVEQLQHEQKQPTTEQDTLAESSSEQRTNTIVQYREAVEDNSGSSGKRVPGAVKVV
jgi:hypothetical protein